MRLEALKAKLRIEEDLKKARRKRKCLMGSKNLRKNSLYRPPKTRVNKASARERQAMRQLQKEVRSLSYSNQPVHDCTGHIEKLETIELDRGKTIEQIRLSRHVESLSNNPERLADYEEGVAAIELAHWYARRTYADAAFAYRRYSIEVRPMRHLHRQMALDAGVPEEYADNVYIVKEEDNITHFYFGGISKIGAPLGQGHGHIVLKGSRTIYRRYPFMPHGAQNHLRPTESSDPSHEASRSA
jgi:hypothetical protein